MTGLTQLSGQTHMARLNEVINLIEKTGLTEKTEKGRPTKTTHQTEIPSPEHAMSRVSSHLVSAVAICHLTLKGATSEVTSLQEQQDRKIPDQKNH